MAATQIPFSLPHGAASGQKYFPFPIMDDTDASNNPSLNVLTAFGSILGYIGGEAPTPKIFERLLWPQRALSGFRASQLLWHVLLTPMGGPMHKAAFEVLDIIFRHGLFKGGQQGHMLGTAFFPETEWTYTMHGQGLVEGHTEPLRNCLWAQALSQMPMPVFDMSPSFSDAEKSPKWTTSQAERVRAKVRVSHLAIEKASQADKDSKLPFIGEDYGTVSPRVLVGIVASELSAIITAAVVGATFRTLWALIWLLPLGLRLLSAMFALEHEPLVDATSSTSAKDPPCDFEVHCPPSEGNFVLMTGLPPLVLQFARHYGHPKRNRSREVTQLVILALSACLFPVELVLCSLWMPVTVQNIWLGYQLYVVLAMSITRYSRLGLSSETPSVLAKALVQEGSKADGQGSPEQSLLFGHTRYGPETLKVSVVSTYHHRYKAGKEAMDSLVGRKMERHDSDVTLVGSVAPAEKQLKQFQKGG